MTAQVWEKSYPAGVRWDAEFPVAPLYSLIDTAAAKFGDKYLCDFMDRRFTFREMHGLINRAAKGFQQLGVKKGVHVGLFLPNTPHYIIAFFGILKAGGTVVNYSPLDAAKELAHKIDDSQTDIMVTVGLNAVYPQMGRMLGSTRLKKLIVGQLQEMLPFPKNLLFPLARRKEIAAVPRDEHHVTWRQLLDNDGRYTPVAVEDPKNEVAVLQYTGGTTGVPKGAMLTHANLVAAQHQAKLWTEGDPPILTEGREKVLAVLPMFHIYALTMILLAGVRGGAEIILHPRFELHAVMRDIDRKKATVFPGVPTMYMAIISAPDVGRYDLSSLKYCGSGGAPLPVEIQERFEGMSGCKLVEGWGMTETCAPGLLTPVIGMRKKGSAGLPAPGCVIDIVDVDEPLKLLPLGQTGEICITGPNVMKGYWNKPEATAEAFAGGRLHTGDVGYMDGDGFVFLVDRKKDMIISGGFNVYPRNIEDAIYLHPSVEEVTVIGIPDDYRGQSAKAFIKLKAGAPSFTYEELREFLQDKVGKHEMPVAMEIRPALPKTIVGKLSKKELIEEEAKKHAAAGAGKAAE
ncbi:MAG TPA: AMP-binding protein [Candidatus Sulfotelmatobacter sp.]|nr:AMP-binding protein [Candidatus Sulfotelmatobacter sp.]